MLQVKQNISKTPKLYYYRKFPTKLLKYSDSIIDLKMHYREPVYPMVLRYIPLNSKNLNKNWNPIIGAISKLLDVIPKPYEYVEKETQLARKTISFIGSREQLEITADIFNQVYSIYYGSIKRKTKLVRLGHRQIRRRRRRKGITQKTQDARLKISSFKSRLLSFLTQEIELLTEELNRINPQIKNKGFVRRKKIKSYIWGKYKKKWRTRL